MAKKKHGMYGTKFYRAWDHMKSRCTCKTSKDYARYGGVGITLCESWYVFQNFYNDMYQLYEEHKALYGEKQTTLDRIDNTSGYSPQNCRWATYKVQNNNRGSVPQRYVRALSSARALHEASYASWGAERSDGFIRAVKFIESQLGT